MAENIKVFLRIRPASAEESERGDLSAVSTNRLNPNSVDLVYSPSTSNFAFDGVLNAHCSQQTVFNQVGRPLMDRVLAGEGQV
jgi:hypothetical protein